MRACTTSGQVDADETLSALVLKLAAEPNGMANAEVPSYTLEQVARITNKLQTRGKIFPAKLSHRRVRYFTGAQRAAAYAEAWKQAANPTPNVIVHKAQAQFDPQAPMVCTADTKYTKAEHKPPRNQVVELFNTRPVERSGSFDFKKYQKFGRY